MTNEDKALVPIETGWVMPPTVVKRRMAEIDQYRAIMREGEDYGTIPGTPKPTLYQPGADTLCLAAGLTVGEPIIEKSIEDWEFGFFFYLVKQPLLEQGGNIVGWGIGSCSSKEDKYAWRWIPVWELLKAEQDDGASRQEAEARLKAKAQAEGWRREWRFSKKRGQRYLFYRLPNPDVYSQANTILKMAVKRAYISATLRATAAHRVFTQDIEDMPPSQRQAAVEVVEAEYEVVQETANGPTPEPSEEHPVAPEAAEAPAQDAPSEPKNIGQLFTAGLRLGYKDTAVILAALGHRSKTDIVDIAGDWRRLQEQAKYEVVQEIANGRR